MNVHFGTVFQNRKKCDSCALVGVVGDWRFSISFVCFGANDSLYIMQMKLIQGRPDKFTDQGWQNEKIVLS